MYNSAYDKLQAERRHKQQKQFVINLLLVVHYGVIIYTTGTALVVAWVGSVNGFDFARIAGGAIAADLVLFASAEGIRHGVFLGYQRKLAIVFYGIALVDVALCVLAESHAPFASFYLGTMLPVSGPLMGAMGLVLLATFMQENAKLRKTAAGIRLDLKRFLDEVHAEEMVLDRARVEYRQAKRTNKTYKKQLRAKMDGQEALALMGRHVKESVPAIYGLLGLDDGAGGKPVAVVDGQRIEPKYEPSKRAKEQKSKPAKKPQGKG